MKMIHARNTKMPSSQPRDQIRQLTNHCTLVNDTPDKKGGKL